MTAAQSRLLDTIRAYGGTEEGGGAEYWPVVNDWVRDSGPQRSLALRNIDRSISALIRAGQIRLDEDGYLHIT